MRSMKSFGESAGQILPPPPDSESSSVISEESSSSKPISTERGDLLQKRQKAAERFQNSSSLYQSVTEVTPPSQRYTMEKTGAVREVEFDPTLIAKGGEHLVFDFEHPKHRDVVYKVNFNRSLAVLHAALRGEVQQKEAVKELKEQIENQREKVKELRSYFGFEAVPPQQFMVRDVPVSREIYQALTNSSHRQSWFPEKIPAWVVVQRKIDLEHDQTVPLTAFYPEKGLMSKKNPEAYEKLFDAAHVVLTNPDAVAERGVSLNEQKAMALSMFPQLMPVADEAQHDPDFQKKLQETAHQLVRYMQETGNALDLAGSNNAVLMKEGNEWKIRFPDPFVTSAPSRVDSKHPEQKMTQVDDLVGFIKDFRVGFGFDEEQRTFALNTMNTVRVTNALAILAEIPDRVTIPQIQTLSPKLWREVFTPMFQDRNRPTKPPTDEDVMA